MTRPYQLEVDVLQAEVVRVSREPASVPAEPPFEMFSDPELKEKRHYNHQELKRDILDLFTFLKQLNRMGNRKNYISLSLISFVSKFCFVFVMKTE